MIMPVVWYVARDKKTGIDLFKKEHKSWVKHELKRRGIKQSTVDIVRKTIPYTYEIKKWNWLGDNYDY